MERIEKKYDETIRQLTASIENLTFVAPSFDPPPFEVAVGKDSQGHSLDPLFESSDRRLNVTNRSSNKFGRMTRLPKVASRSDSDSLLQIYAKKPKTGCMAWCSCSCHKTSSLRINKPNNLAVGSLALTFSGMPYFTAGCDQKACALRSTPLVKLTIQFPKWLWNGYVSSSFAYNPLEGSQLSLRLPRAVGWSSKLWGYGTEGNVEGIQKLFSQGLASPWDVQGLGGSALHVRDPVLNLQCRKTAQSLTLSGFCESPLIFSLEANIGGSRSMQLIISTGNYANFLLSWVLNRILWMISTSK